MFNAVGSHIPGHANTKNPVDDQEVTALVEGAGVRLLRLEQSGHLSNLSELLRDVLAAWS